MSEFDKRFEKLRCNLYIPAEIVEEVDEMAKRFGANRSVMVSILLKTMLDQQKVINMVGLAQKEQGTNE